MTIAEPAVDERSTTPDQIADLVRSLAELMDERAVTELDLTFGSLSVRLRRPNRAVGQLERIAAAEVPQGPAAPDHSHLVTAPMVGTYYSAPTPSAQPFVNKGDRVVAGQTIGIIEAMKIMNEIASDRSGVILELFVDNGQPVEYGSPLLRLAPDDAHP